MLRKLPWVEDRRTAVEVQPRLRRARSPVHRLSIPPPAIDTKSTQNWRLRPVSCIQMALPTQVFRLLFGRPLATSEERAEHIGPLAGIPVFGLDALSSAAYGPEAALTLLIPLGLAGVNTSCPSARPSLCCWHCVLQLPADHRGLSARRRIIHVATENLGAGAGLLAAAALMTDYILTAAVGISAGVGALISAVPACSRTRSACASAYSPAHHREHARGPRHRRGVHDSYLPLHGHAARCHRCGRVACSVCRGWPSATRGAACPCYLRPPPPSACGCCSRSSPRAARP